MALAVKNPPETTSSSMFDRLPIAIFAGVLYVVGSLAVVGKLLPTMWWEWLNLAPTFVNWTLLGLILVVATAVLVYVGAQLLGPHPAHGVKAGIFTGLVAVLMDILLTRWASLWTEHWAYQGYFDPLVGIVVTSVFGLILLVGTAILFLRPKTQQWLMNFEDQGWFSRSSYKRSQGLLVRRATIFGVVVIVGCGIFTLIEHKTLDTGSKHWQVNMPFTGKLVLPRESDLAHTDLGQEYEGQPVLDYLVTPSEQYERVVDKGESDLEPGRIISRQKYLEEAKALRGKGKEPPDGAPVIDRFVARDAKNAFQSKWVKIAYPGDLPANQFSEGQVIPLVEYEKQLEKLHKERNPDEPRTATPTFPEATTEYAAITLLPNLKFTLPILLIFLGIWMAWRVVNFPVFADFLIATEAELNKVSWTTGKRLRQDTVVVLTTVVLLTITLLVFDWFWYKALSAVNVLQIPETKKHDAASGARPY